MLLLFDQSGIVLVVIVEAHTRLGRSCTQLLFGFLLFYYGRSTDTTITQLVQQIVLKRLVWQVLESHATISEAEASIRQWLEKRTTIVYISIAAEHALVVVMMSCIGLHGGH